MSIEKFKVTDNRIGSGASNSEQDYWNEADGPLVTNDFTGCKRWMTTRGSDE